MPRTTTVRREWTIKKRKDFGLYPSVSGGVTDADICGFLGCKRGDVVKVEITATLERDADGEGEHEE